MMLSTARLIKCLPDLGDEPLDWLPVDVAAKAFLEAAGPRKEHGEMPVFHVLNPHHEPSWTQMLQWLQKEDQFEIVSPKEWVERLEQAGDSDHSALKLLGLWKESYGRELTEKTARPQFSTRKTSESVQALRNVEPLDKEYVERIWNWIQENVK